MKELLRKLSIMAGRYYINIHRTIHNDNDGPYTIKCSAIQYITGINLRGPVAVITRGQSMNPLTSITPSNASQKTLRWSKERQRCSYHIRQWNGNRKKSSKGKIHPQFLFVCYYDEQTGEEKEILCKSSRVCYL